MLDGMSTSSHSRYSVRSVSGLIARLVSSSVRFNADLPLANVFTASSSSSHQAPYNNAAAAAVNKVSTPVIFPLQPPQSEIHSLLAFTVLPCCVHFLSPP